MNQGRKKTHVTDAHSADHIHVGSLPDCSDQSASGQGLCRPNHQADVSGRMPGSWNTTDRNVAQDDTCSVCGAMMISDTAALDPCVWCVFCITAQLIKMWSHTHIAPRHRRRPSVLPSSSPSRLTCSMPWTRSTRGLHRQDHAAGVLSLQRVASHLCLLR